MIWKPYQPNESQPWNFSRAKHLHRRAGFGATWSELQHDIQDGPHASITRVLDGKTGHDGYRENFESMSEIIGNSAANSTSGNRLVAWWLYRLLFSPHALREKITLMWHSHFATSNLKVDDLLLMFNQNTMLRDKAFGNFGELLRAVLRDPAMMYWLDANSNRKSHPNENLAREVMELFTLGVGNYTESDVKETARALTGWSVQRDRAIFKPEQHDASEKSILGKTGRFDIDSLADLLLAHKATSQRLAWRLCDTFMGEGVVDEAAMNDLATGLQENQLNIRWGIETILRSELFFATENIATRISSPIEYIASTVRSLELFEHPPSTLVLAEWCGLLGQRLFFPPNVAGWPGGRNWLNTRTIVGRSNFAAALMAGDLHSRTMKPNMAALARKHGKESSDARTKFFVDLLLSCPKGLDANTPKPINDQVAHILSQPEAVLT